MLHGPAPQPINYFGQNRDGHGQYFQALSGFSFRSSEWLEVHNKVFFILCFHGQVAAAVQNFLLDPLLGHLLAAAVVVFDFVGVAAAVVIAVDLPFPNSMQKNEMERVLAQT